ncbi:Malate:quinone oxidoreductase [Campylobacter majalis]|uniref:malate dehydrogenase (quinone) n=1 Tax=Campylobacter majalis TaxID=2790656 RepID=A0ABM8Q4G3_9BACT|nr:FAD-dependent oxidoreductase [Campylobacter majalis]CAD7287776.1 Malate:quinone oxidoreductase [Campylobacter majalis]
MSQKHYEVVIIGGGISGSALMYCLANFTDIKSVALLEKYDTIAPLNSKGECNSQTIHSGDIETNYSFDKAKSVAKIAQMPIKYALKYNYENKFMFSHQKMVLGVGEKECDLIQSRFEIFKEIYPYLELFDKNELKSIEPNVVFKDHKSERSEKILAMGARVGQYTTIDFGAMSVSLVNNAKTISKDDYELHLNCNVKEIKKIGDKFYLKTNDSVITASCVVVNAGSYSLFLAHQMGYAQHLSTLPVAGSFYFANKKLLNGKVYMVQNDKLPFAALHGDPDILANELTRFGPTALVMPKLERYHGMDSFYDFFECLKFDKKIAKIFIDLLKDRDIANYLIKNFLYEIPFINKHAFVKEARKIVPSLRIEDIKYAKNFGGIRPQVIDKNSGKLEFGEGKIVTNDGIIFNMTPSPGATSCFATAKSDLEHIVAYLDGNFNIDKFNAEFFE